ncbi:MAG: arginine--tRNA ligase, partial [Planctomycetales bacterium]|nr:arginine--tRNA ligase [Planctomycetales bacterium]
HIGDWGTQFGMILYGYKHFVDEEALEAEPVAELSRLYRLVNQLMEFHETRDEKIPRLQEKLAAQQRIAADLQDAAAAAEPADRKKAGKRA